MRESGEAHAPPPESFTTFLIHLLRGSDSVSFSALSTRADWRGKSFLAVAGAITHEAAPQKVTARGLASASRRGVCAAIDVALIPQHTMT